MYRLSRSGKGLFSDISLVKEGLLTGEAATCQEHAEHVLMGAP